MQTSTPSVRQLLKWCSDLHSIAADNWTEFQELTSIETGNQLEILARLYDEIRSDEIQFNYDDIGNPW